jgi:hypothetical protein
MEKVEKRLWIASNKKILVALSVGVQKMVRSFGQAGCRSAIYPGFGCTKQVYSQMIEFEIQNNSVNEIRFQDEPPVEEPPNRPKKPPVKEPEDLPEPQPPPAEPPVKEPPNEPEKPPVKEPPPKDPDREPPRKPPIRAVRGRRSEVGAVLCGCQTESALCHLLTNTE